MMQYPGALTEDFPFPLFYPVRITFPNHGIKDIPKKMDSLLHDFFPDCGIRKKDRIAIAAGSRGISNLPLILKPLITKLKDKGAVPYIVPAMGSHGGATPEGQEKILDTAGLNRETMDADILSSMDVARLGKVYDEVPVFFAREALKADHIIVVNRVRPHTKFKAEIESGLHKMLVVGLGKHKGAALYHKYALKYGFYPLLCQMAACIMENTPLRFGIAIVEDGNGNTADIQLVLKKDFAHQEAALLKQAKALLPTLPVPGADCLIIREIGKDIAGPGMDPHVTGRAADLMEDDFSGFFHATRIAVLSLTANTHGNGLGIGNADFITNRVYDALDAETTLLNAFTGMSLKKAHIPIRVESDKMAFTACFTTLGPKHPETVKAVFIKNTKSLGKIFASKALLPEIQSLPNVRVGKGFPLSFDNTGKIMTGWDEEEAGESN